MDDADRTPNAVVTEATNAGAFGASVVFVSFEPDDRIAGQDQYASVVLFGTATVSDGEGARRQHQLVIKLKHPLAEVREFLGNDLQFHNEIRFYELAVPFLLAGAPSDHVPPFCRYFYGRNDCGALASQAAIVLENACVAGYRSSKHRLDLDIEHLVVALKTLAKFHGLSYRAKHKHPAKFFEIVSGFQDTQLHDNQWMMGESVFKELISSYFDKLQFNRDASKDVEQVRWFHTEFVNDPNRMMQRAMEPVEPLAVLCHGDFNRNNLLFRYDDSGKPVDALPLDTATVRYGSPALDLSFFLYMNTDRRLRDEHWDLLLDEYCAALATAVSDLAGESVPVPNREQLDAEMRERAFYGLAHVSFFMRIMMDENLPKDFVPQFANIDLKNVCPLLLTIGGDRATDRILDVVEHFIHIHCRETTPL